MLCCSLLRVSCALKTLWCFLPLIYLHSCGSFLKRSTIWSLCGSLSSVLTTPCLSACIPTGAICAVLMRVNEICSVWIYYYTYMYLTHQVQSELWYSGSVGPTPRHRPSLPSQQSLREAHSAAGVKPCSSAHPRAGGEGKAATLLYMNR